MLTQPSIDWSYSGAPDPLAGTGAAPMEQVLLWSVGLLGAALMIALQVGGYVGWSWWQTAVGALMAFDLMGGATAGALNSSKRFYFSPAQENETGIFRLLKSGYYLPIISVHPLLIYLLYKPNEPWTGVEIYLAVGAAAILVRQAPIYLARPISVACLIAAIVANIYLFSPVPGFEWMLPVLVMKLVLGHGVREEPYRPERRT